MCCVFHACCYFNGTLQNFFVLKKIPGTFVLKRYKRKISKLEKDTRFFNSASVLLNFFTNRASNVTYVLLNKYKHCQLRHFLYFLYFCPCLELGLLMSYLCDFFFSFIFIFIMINRIISWRQAHLLIWLFFEKMSYYSW